MNWSSDQCHRKKGNTILKKDFVSYADKKVTCQENVQRRRNVHHTKEKVDSKEERKEDLATVVTFEQHQMMVTTDYTKNIRALTKTMSRDEKTSLMLSLAEETEDF